MKDTRHRDRPATRRVDAGDAYFRIKQQLMVAPDALGEAELGAAQRRDAGFDDEQVVEPGRLQVLGRDRAHREGYAFHYRNEELESYPDWPSCGDGSGNPGSFDSYRCIIVRGPGWQKDTMPAELICTGLQWGGNGRPSYENCVFPADQ